MFQYMTLSYRVFEQAIWEKACESPANTCSGNADDELDAEDAPNHRPPVLSPIGRPISDFGGVLDAMVTQLKENSCHFELFQQVADRYDFMFGRQWLPLFMLSEDLNPTVAQEAPVLC